MFDKKDIEAYQSLRASSDLKARILADAETSGGKRARILENSRLIKQMTAVAACFLLVITVFAASTAGGPDMVLLYEGESVTREGVAVAMAQPMTIGDEIAGRSVSEICIPFSVTSEKRATISIESGRLYEAGEDGELLGEQTEIIGETHLLWVLDAETEASELRVKCGLRSETYGLEITEDQPTGIIYKK